MATDKSFGCRFANTEKCADSCFKCELFHRDYISREECIKDLREYEKTAFSGLTVIGCISRIKRIPAADVRPVVLCRDCKHFNPYPGDCTDGGIEGVCKRHNSIGVLVMDEDFCSDAERI